MNKNIFPTIRRSAVWIGLAVFMLLGCVQKNRSQSKDSAPETTSNTDTATVSWQCTAPQPQVAEITHLFQLGCGADFEILSSLPISADIPGARSVKVVIDRLDGNHLYFQNSKRYPIHFDFASAHLSGNGLPRVPSWTEFNINEYYSMDRRFLLGAVTYYEEAETWAYEIAPYDTSTAEMVASSYELIAQNTFFGEQLVFHPTSEAVDAIVPQLPESVVVKTTAELFEDITYQPLNLSVAYGQLKFYDAAQLNAGTVYVNFRDIAVLNQVPNDISAVSGIVTAQFQTPLSHINVLSQNRGTPNMGLKNVHENTLFRTLENKWVKLTVGPHNYQLVEVTKAEADMWWEQHRPTTVQVPALDTSVTGLVNTEDILDSTNFVAQGTGLKESVRAVIPAFGGKAAHYAVFSHMDNAVVPHAKAFSIPVYYYVKFMEDNHFFAHIDAMLEDVSFQNSAAVRDEQLAALRKAMHETPLDAEFENMVTTKIHAEYPGIPMRFRSSTNAEDLEGFSGAGLYTSKTGNPADPSRPVADAIRKVWASVWFFRAFDEREYRGISHKEVGMALLVHRSFPDEEANGVAVTGNIYDTTGMMPGFYINVQEGEASVVKPEQGITTDQFILQYDMPGQPITYLGHSNLISSEENVLTRAQILQLGAALSEIHVFFKDAYGTNDITQFYAMDCEFKFDGEPGQPEQLFIKQARPYPGWNSAE